jgi:PAS domain-containing protein
VTAGAPSQQKSLPLILARELSSNLATPMFIMDADGTIVFYNEAAEQMIGRPFAEVGEVSVVDWSLHLELSDTDGTPLRRRETPAGISLLQRRPAHRRLQATGFDGVRRTFDMTAYPLFARSDEMPGAVTLFWECEAS